MTTARPVLIALDLAETLGLLGRVETLETAHSGVVRLTEAELLSLGASRLEWGEPDEHGWYTPTLYADAPAAIE